MNFDLIDAATLNKGDQIPAALIERVTGLDRFAAPYRLAMLAVRKWLTTELRRLGRPATIRARGDCLVLLTDAEAVKYNPGQFDGGAAPHAPGPPPPVRG